MVATANAGGPKIPNHLRILNGRDDRKDGIPTDSGGRPIVSGPDFKRNAPSKPEGLTDAASWLWDQVVEQMGSIGMLKPLDGPALKMACETYSRWEQAKDMRLDLGPTMQTASGERAGPWVGIEERAGKEFRAWCAEFGFTPAAERNLVSQNEAAGDDNNPF